MPPDPRPIIGLTADAAGEKFQLGRSYVAMASRAGGVPIVLPCQPEHAQDYLEACDAIILTGGDDPRMARWNVPQHPKSTPMDPARQEFELALLDALKRDQSKPVLGICLGMQLMGLHAGGTLDQCLADSLPTAELHWDKRAHAVSVALGEGAVHSHHRQALTDPGELQVIATAEDGVIEAVKAADRPFYVGVQWHPERTADSALGEGVFAKLVQAARKAKSLKAKS